MHVINLNKGFFHLRREDCNQFQSQCEKQTYIHRKRAITSINLHFAYSEVQLLLYSQCAPMLAHGPQVKVTAWVSCLAQR